MERAVIPTHNWRICNITDEYSHSYNIGFTKDIRHDSGYSMNINFSRSEDIKLDKEKLSRMFGDECRLDLLAYDTNVQIMRCEKSFHPLVAEAFLGNGKYIFGRMNNANIYSAADFARCIDKHIADFDSWKYLFSTLPEDRRAKLEELLVQSPPAIQRTWVKKAIEQFAY